MKSAAELREAAQRYREMAGKINDQWTIKALQELAAEYEALADRLDNAPPSPQVDRRGEP